MSSSPEASVVALGKLNPPDLIELFPMAAYAVRAPDGAIAWFNSQAAELWGRTPALGDTEERFCGAHKLYHADGSYMAHGDTPVALALNTGASVHEEEVIIERPDGSRVTVSVHIDPIRDENNTIIGVVNFFHDITRRKQVVVALRASKQELTAHADDLENEVRLRTQELEAQNALVLEQSRQLRELSHRLLKSQDEERRRIARELHDSLGQIAAALSMSLSGAIHRVSRYSGVRKVLGECRAMIDRLTDEIRTLSYLLHPPLLEETGLAQAMLWYVAGLRERSGLEVQIEIPEGFDRLPDEIELAMFRILQECLTNIHRHSNSKTANIKLSRNGDAVCLEVQDQGNGISAEKFSQIEGSHSGVGITGMRERVRHLKGVMDIHSDSHGTKILVTLPALVASEASDLERFSAAG